MSGGESPGVFWYYLYSMYQLVILLALVVAIAAYLVIRKGSAAATAKPDHHSWPPPSLTPIGEERNFSFNSSPVPSEPTLPPVQEPPPIYKSPPTLLPVPKTRPPPPPATNSEEEEEEEDETPVSRIPRRRLIQEVRAEAEFDPRKVLARTIVGSAINTQLLKEGGEIAEALHNIEDARKKL